MVSRAPALASFSIICCISAWCFDVPRGMEAFETMEISLAFWDGKSGFEAINSSKLKTYLAKIMLRNECWNQFFGDYLTLDCIVWRSDQLKNIVR